MDYKITIENGVTIINTGDDLGGLKNKSGHVGIHYIEESQKYIAKIFIGKKYHHLGYFDDIDDAIAIREEAEQHRADGTFTEWYPTLVGRTKKYSRQE